MASGVPVPKTRDEEEAQLRAAIENSLGKKGIFAPAYKKVKESAEDVRAALFNRLYQVINDFLEDNRATYTHVPASGDGNCLFNAISRQIHGDETHAAQFRTYAANRILTNDVDFPAAGFPDQNKAAYVAAMRIDGEYGGEQEIRALSMVLQRPFVVYSYSIDTESMTVTIYGDRESYGGIAPVTLLHYGLVLHYNSLLLNNVRYPLKGQNDPNPAAWAATRAITEPMQAALRRPGANFRAEVAAIDAAVARATASVTKYPGYGVSPAAAAPLAASLLLQSAALSSAIPEPPADEIAESLAASLLLQNGALAASSESLKPGGLEPGGGGRGPGGAGGLGPGRAVAGGRGAGGLGPGRAVAGGRGPGGDVADEDGDDGGDGDGGLSLIHI